jgi:hypothetical protein
MMVSPVEHVGYAALFLASKEAGYITGQMILSWTAGRSFGIARSADGSRRSANIVNIRPASSCR